MTDPADIRAWQRIDASTTTSGRLLAADIDRLAGIGVRHVVNLAMPDHPDALADEDALCAAHGIAYTAIPIPFDAPVEAHYQIFRAAISNAAGPVHVHCILNWRVSAFFYRWNRENGMAESGARGLMAQHWDPDENDHPAAAIWAALIGR
ncbi:hypothetical protein EKN06_08415 [Croceicoccus ponticola]|uniref:Phosphatase n=1 Tax=Croceicoccus ponticola TaxID=2217664 RepID=A0A437GX48_9SPHN|nr:sulfur transferase domain-containing protein [Croceicoccus ponticola]RVQ66960.1 hypothetical protein EKN06_08415 [Croceicoccus ponticola]